MFIGESPRGHGFAGVNPSQETARSTYNERTNVDVASSKAEFMLDGHFQLSWDVSHAC